MEPMVTDEPKSSVRFSDPPPPGTILNTPNILHELSKFEQFDENTCYWPDFADRLQECFEIFDVPNDKRVRIFIDRISNATYEKLRAICKPIAPLEKSLDELWAIMDRHFNKYWNVLKERVKFTRRHQRALETVLNFASQLKLWSRNCKFPEPWLQEALITQFLNGLRSEVLRAKAFELNETDFDRLVDFACKFEEMQASMKAAAEETAITVASTEGSGEAQTMEVDGNSDAVCYTCFEPGHKSPACELKKKPVAKKVKKNQKRKNATNQSTNQKKVTNQKNQTNGTKTPNQNQRINKSKNPNANQFKFENKNQFKNQYRSSYTKPSPKYNDQPSGRFSDDFKDLLRNQYKDLHRSEYSNQSYSNDYSYRARSSTSNKSDSYKTLSSTYEANKSLFFR